MRVNRILPIAVLLLVAFALTSSGMSIGLGSRQEIDLEKGLVAYLSFDGGEGDIAFDESGNHNDAGVMCAGKGCSLPKWVEGKIGYALDFDGVDDWVKVAFERDLDLFGGTIAFWASPGFSSSEQDRLQEVISLHNIAGEQFELTHGWLGEPPVPFLWFVWRSWNTKGYHLNVYNPTFNADEWRLWIGVWEAVEDGIRMAFYLNGTIVGFRTVPSEAFESFRFCGVDVTMDANGRYFDGRVDEVRIYNRALTEEEMKALYALGQEGV